MSPNIGDNTVSVISMVTGSPIPALPGPFSAAVTADGSKVYVTNNDDRTVSVISTATNTVLGSPISFGSGPGGAAVTPEGDIGSPISVGTAPFDVSIIRPSFAGTPTFPTVTASASRRWRRNMAVSGPRPQP